MNSKTVAIHQPQYLPWIPYFDKILRSDFFILLDNVQFQKNGMQNRNQIKTPQGAVWLTVPIKHSFGQLISEVEISDVRSVVKHLKTVEMNYKKAPYYEQVFPMLASVVEKSPARLVNLNNELLFQLLKYLQYQGEIVLASDLDVEGEGSDLVLNICKEMKAKSYISGTGGKNYMNLTDFEKNRIQIVFQEFKEEEYPQMFEKIGFVKNLSIVDLLFNLGSKKSVQYIEEGRLN